MARGDGGMIDDALDWFAENPTGGGAPPQPFREIVPGIWSQDIQYGTGNSVTIETDAGLVQVDTGIERDHAEKMIAAVREVTDQPLHAIVYSHGHTAYNHGVEAWLDHAATRGDPVPASSPSGTCPAVTSGTGGRSGGRS